MRCPKCGSVTAVSHSNWQGDAQYRKRYCTSLECRHTFSTWETASSPKAKKPRTNAEFNAHRRDYMARFRAADPERSRQNNLRWKKRRLARQEAAETGEPVEAIYERWGVS